MERRRPILSITLIVAVVATTLTALPTTPAQALPVDEDSTTGVHIQTLPDPLDATFPGQAQGVATAINDSALTLLIRSNPIGRPHQVWPGIGYPTADIGCPFCASNPNFELADVNDAGLVAGTWNNSAGTTYPFVWSEADGFTQLPLPPGATGTSGATVTGIDAAGNITGTFLANTDTCDNPFANTCSFFGRRAGDGSYTLSVIGDFGLFATDVGGTTVVGNGWTWTQAGGVIDLEGVGRAINENGQIAGQIDAGDGSVGAAAYWASPTSAPVEIGTLPGDSQSFATGINEAGQVVGWSSTSSDPAADRRAFHFDPQSGVLQDLGTVAGSSTAEAQDLNDTGLVVGSAGGRAVIWDLDGGYDIDYPPEVVFEPIPAVPAGDLLSFQPQISDVEGDRYTADWQALPSGAEGDPDSGLLTWQTAPGDEGDFPVTLTVTQDSEPRNTLTVEFTLRIATPVTLDPIGDQTAPVGEELRFTADSSGATNATYRAISGTPNDPGPLPDGATMTSAGIFTWTPSESQVGDHVVTVIVEDRRTPGIADSETLTITVEPAPSPDTAPSISPIGDLAIDELTEIVVTPEVIDTEGDAYTLTWTGVPPGAVINGIYTWTPTEAQGPGSYEITVRATQDDDPSLFDQHTFTITVNEVNRPPELEPIDNQAVVANSTLHLVATARDADLPEQPLSFAIWGEEVELPAVQGIAIDPVSGAITWTPNDDQVGDHVATVEVTDGAGGSDAVTFAIRVSPDPGNLPPVIAPIDDVTVDEGTLVTIEPVVSDPDEDPFELDWGEVPEGAVINGIYEWIPTEAQGPGVYPITLTATDDRGGTTTRSFTITVDEVNEPPAIDPVDDQSVEAEAPLTFTVEASDRDIPVQDLTFSLQDAPTGAGIDATTGDFSWTPTSDQLGAHVFDLVVSDGVDTATQQLTVTVTAPEIVTDLFVDRFERVAADPDGDGDILSVTDATFEVGYGASPDHDDAPDAQLTVTFDAEELGIGNGVGFFVTDPGPCTIATSPDRGLTCDLGPLEAGDRGTLAFTIRPQLIRLSEPAPYDADIELTARIDTSVTDLRSGSDADQNNQRTIADVVRVRQADLRTILRRPVPLFGALDPVFVGETTSFEVVVDNLGPDRAADTQVEVEWADAAWDLAAAPAGCTELAASFTCDLGDIEDGEQAPTVSFALTETGASLTSHRITAAASSAASDRVPANDTMTLDPDPVERTSDVDVSLELLSGGEGGTTRPREQVTYRATVRNDGPHDSSQTDLVIGFVGHYGGEVTVIDGGGCDSIDGSFPFVAQGLSCDLGLLPAGSFAFATVVFTVEVPLDEQDPWVVSANASTTSVDPDTTNDRTTLGLSVDATEADLLLLPGFLGDPPTATVVEREATWSFVYANGGPDTALAPVLTVEITGETDATVAGPDCTEHEPTATTTMLTCDLEDLPFTIGGGTDTAVVTLSSATTGPISVEASISHPGTDPDTTNDTLGWSLTILPDPGGPATGPLLIDQPTIDPGQDLDIEGSGFDPGSPVPATLFSDPTELGQYLADETGTVATTVTIPADTAPGAHRIVLTGVDPEGNGVILAATVCVSTCADQDTDGDGLTDLEEETLTGTDPGDPDSDGDGLVDGLDTSWLDAHVASVPASSFRWGRLGKLLLRLRLAVLGVTLHQARWDDGLALIDEAASRADGCGARPDRDDVLRDCDTQTEFRTRLELLRRNVAEQVGAAERVVPFGIELPTDLAGPVSERESVVPRWLATQDLRDAAMGRHAHRPQPTRLHPPAG